MLGTTTVTISLETLVTVLSYIYLLIFFKYNPKKFDKCQQNDYNNNELFYLIRVTELQQNRFSYVVY